MRCSLIYTIFLTVFLVAIDLGSKFLATMFLQPVGSINIIPGIFGLRYILNDGAAFSLFAGNRLFLVGVTGIALLALAIYLLFKKPTDKLEYYAMVLVLAGGIGNLIERALNGYVVDFFEFQFINFAVFNIADCFVCIGLGLYLLYFVLDEIKNKKDKSNNKTIQSDEIQNGKN